MHMKQRSLETPAAYLEYPFLERWRPQRNACHAKVEKWTTQTLSVRVPPIRSSFQIYLADSEGKKIARVGRIFSMESVGQALSRIGENANRVRFAISLGQRSPWACLTKIDEQYMSAAEWLKDATREMRNALP